MKQSCYCSQSPVLLSCRQGKMDTGHVGGDQLGTGRAVWVLHPTRGLTPSLITPAATSTNPGGRGDWERWRADRFDGLPAGGKAVQERVILANDLIRAKPFAGGKASVVERGCPWGCVLGAVQARCRGLWLGWGGSASLQAGHDVPPASPGWRTCQQ